MREITRQMYDDFNLKELGYDFMGYEYENPRQLSFHHLVVAHRDCKALHIPHDGYLYWNGAILRQDTAHNYLHTIERYDNDRFEAISSELIDINIQRAILYQNLVYINDVLDSFEREYCGKCNHNGKEIIKEEYTRRRIKL